MIVFCEMERRRLERLGGVRPGDGVYAALLGMAWPITLPLLLYTDRRGGPRSSRP